MAMFEYQRMSLDGPTVRLIRLIKGSRVDNIQCELFEAWINISDRGIPYDALSYTWGGTVKAAVITVNGYIMNITSNLFAALQHLRLEDEDRILWIDAICINQGNDLERSHQVQHMSIIYKEAEQVIIWLGQSTEETDFIMDSLKRLQENNVNVGGDWRLSAQLWMHPQTGLGDMDIYQHRLRKGMKLLLKRPWFRRIWILQEVANARVAIVVCGTKSISARIFAQVPSLIELEPDPHCQSVLDIMPGLSRKESWWGRKRNLYTLLLKFRDSEATDERDIIYALLGLSSDANKCKSLLPDYEKSTQDVIRDATSFLLSYIGQADPYYGFLNWTMSEFLRSLDSLSSAVLRSASETGNEKMVKLLLSTDGVDVDSKGIDGQTLIHRAVRGGHDAVTLVLLEKSANVNVKDGNGRTPLSWAAENGHEIIVNQLLEWGADINSKDLHDRTPLLEAFEAGNSAIHSKLRRKGAEYKLIDRTPRFDYYGDKLFDIDNELDNYRLRLQTESKRALGIETDTNGRCLTDYPIGSHYHGGSGRSIVEYHSIPALVEWWESPVVDNTEAQFQKIAHFETFMSSTKDETARLLQSKGFYFNRYPGHCKIGILYQLPEFADSACTHVTLQSLVKDWYRQRPSLGQRFKIARQLSVAILKLHTNFWLHKCIAPQNILFFTMNGGEGGQSQEPDFGNPFISGFRTLTQLEERPEEILYETFGMPLHPEQEQGELRDRLHFRREFDIFSFGYLLFILATWRSLETRLSTKDTTITLERFGQLCERLEADVGEIYVSTILWCVGLAPGSPIAAPLVERSADVLSQENIKIERTLTREFWEHVIKPLEALVV